MLLTKVHSILQNNLPQKYTLQHILTSASNMFSSFGGIHVGAQFCNISKESMNLRVYEICPPVEKFQSLSTE